MRAAARRRVVATVIATVAVVAIGFSVAHAEGESDTATIEGRLLVAHGDNFGGGMMAMGAEVRTEHGTIHLKVPAAKHHQFMLLSGKRVKVRGKAAAAGTFAAQSVSGTAPATAAAPRAMNIAVIMMHTKGSTTEPASLADVQKYVFNKGSAIRTVADYYAEVSGNQVAVSGRAFGYYDASYAVGASCPSLESALGGYLGDAQAKAAKDGFKAGDYQHVVVYTPHMACGFSGAAWIGASGVVMNGTLAPSVIEHELGHNLGAWHAGSMGACGAASCVVDYGDPYDVMGQSGYHFSVEHKRMFGWVPASAVKTVTSGTQTIDLTAQESLNVPGATSEIIIPLPDGTSYFLEHRHQASGIDQGLSGLWLRLKMRVATDDTVLPPLPLMASGNIPRGSTFTDTKNKITIKALAEDKAIETVQVCVGSCTSTPPTTNTTTPPPASSTTTSSSTTSTSTTSTTSTTVPPPSSAVAVEVVKGKIVVQGTAGNDVVHLVKIHDNSKSVDANGAAITVGRGCKLDGSKALCRGSAFIVQLGAGNDSLTMSGERAGVRSLYDGGDGNDTFVGGPGPETFVGGAGFDTVDYRNRGAGLVVLIGGGPHSGAKNEHDTIEPDIERVLMP